MTIGIGNAPCFWGVEWAGDPPNPDWTDVLRDCAQAGYKGIEPGPVGFMPEDPAILSDAFAENGLTLIGGVVFRPFDDPAAWDDVWDGVMRTCKALKADGAQHLVLIDSISARRAPTAGRVAEAEQMDTAVWTALVDRIRTVAKLGAEDCGLTVGIHAHAGGFIDFEPELERLLNDIDESNLGQGEVDFSAVHQLLETHNFSGWCTVELDCDPAGATSPIDDARANRGYLGSIGFTGGA